MSERTIQIPACFHHPLWFNTNEITFEDTLDVHELAEIPFLLDILGEKRDSTYPEFDREAYINRFFECWRVEKEHISEAFSQRNRQVARPKMVLGIGWFITSIFWINGKKVDRLTHLKDDLSIFPIQPVNLNERLTFLIENPDHYQSFIQLAQVFEELEKKWVKAIHKKQHMDKK
ncbi:YpoC family protein [Pseudalkalibacillus sp. A8]|uniref:YpoC family protein n=1 Tax=Pseudalkalibacillus sp. A8 TaxID=3382641 RepID=UPI0038B55ED8